MKGIHQHVMFFPMCPNRHCHTRLVMHTPSSLDARTFEPDTRAIYIDDRSERKRYGTILQAI